MSTNVGKVSIIQKLDSTSPAQIANIPEVADRFQQIYAIMNGSDVNKAKVKYEAEKFHFMKLIQDKPDLQQCTKLSLYGCFLDMAVNGLSFDTNRKHAYVVAFNTNVGNKQNPKWEKRASLMISGYGELHMRIEQGQIKYADNPILVYEGDEFRHGTKDGKVFLDHVASYPRKTDNIIACYIRIERNDSSHDYKVLSIEEVNKLKAFSKDPNSKAWTDGLPGMIQAKTLKHAFKSYPRVKIRGEFTQLQTDIIDAENEIISKIDYCVDIPAATAVIDTGSVETAATASPVTDDEFASTQPPAGSSVTLDDDNF